MYCDGKNKRKMRMGRKIKTLAVLCVVVILGFYIFYGSLTYTGTSTDHTVSRNNNAWKNHSWRRNTEQQRNKKDKAIVLHTPHMNAIIPKQKIAMTKSLMDELRINNNTTTSYDVTDFITGSHVTTGQINIDRVRENIAEEHETRLRNLHFSCASQITRVCEDVRKCNLTEFYYSRQYNFAYCKVPKSGSTFWMKLFLVLHHGHSEERYSKLINTWSRSDIHTRSRRLVTSPLKIYKDKIPTIVVSRNPYSRLFSAYVDKVFMPLFWHLFDKMAGVRTMPYFWINRTVDALKKSNKPLPKRLMAFRDQMEQRGLLKKLRLTTKITPVCVNNASFTDFLKFLITVYKAGRVLEPHWAPINDLCRPCLFNTEGIVKQESFSEDVFHIINSFHINSSGLDSIKMELFDRRVENSIPGIVGVVERKAASKDVKMCISNTEIIRRLWKAFQIQGYISDKVDAPSEILTERFNKDLIVSKAMQALLMEPLSSEQSSNQRRTHLIKAYRTVSPDIIKDIQMIFRSDFELFDYSMDPPK